MKKVEVSELQGTWAAKKTSEQKWIKGTNGCQIVFLADGTFTGSVPDYLMMTFDKASGQVMSGKGQWSLEPPKTLAPIGIKLSFNEVNGERRTWDISNVLMAERRGKDVEMFFYVGEEGGERFVFERALSQ